MNILYLGSGGPYSLGVKKKILGQFKALNDAFDTAYLADRHLGVAYLRRDQRRIVDKNLSLTKEDYYRIVIKWIINYNINVIYIRYPFANIFFIEFLENIRPIIDKILIEIPTYPYDDHGLSRDIVIPDLYYRNQIKHYVDFIVTFSGDETIWGIPCIKTHNGVDIDEVPLRNYSAHNGVKLITAASLSSWHGLERVFIGLAEYYTKRDDVSTHVSFDVIGNGDALGQYRTLVSELSISDKVCFLMDMSGNEFDEMFDNADVAIGTLGGYKIGLERFSPIKTAEYCARGVPFIYAYNDERFATDLDFVRRIPNDDSPVDLEAIIHMNELLSIDISLSSRMRSYAVENLSWHKMMEPIIRSI